MSDNKLIGAIIAVILVLFMLNSINVPDFPKKLFSIVSGTETQLKSEYTTDWSNKLDGDITSRSGENSVFSWTSGANPTETDGEFISTFSSVRFKKDFYGQEVVVFARIVGEDANIANVRFGSTYMRDFKEYIIKFIPRTLDLSKVDVYISGVSSFSSIIPFTTLNVQKPFYLTFNGNDNIGGRIVFDYVGHKAQFQCDLAPDEVSIEESFAQSFSQNDLSFPVTKWMYPCRPATLRDITQGETPITPNPYPALNKGEILPVPLNSIATIHYATPNIVGRTNPCKLDEANVKIGDKWVCQKLIPTATTIYRNITTREIIPVLSSTSFTATKNFNIGTSSFSFTNKFNCNIPSGEDIVSFPNPDANCYKATANYEGKEYIFSDKQLLQLNNYISSQYFASGEIRRADGGITQDLHGLFIFNVINPFIIDVDGGITIRHNEQGKIRMKLTNNLPSGKILIKAVQKVKNTNQFLPEQTIELNAIKGDNFFDIPVNTENLGVNEISIEAFYIIEADAKIYIPSDKIRISLEILGDQPSIIQFVEKEPIVIEKPIFVQTPSTAPEKESFFDTIPTSVKIIGAILFIGILTRL